jgi:SAM-dependent methyltransferase
MSNASLVAHAGLPFANPMSEGEMDAAIAALSLGSGSTVLETGCGSGEILVRTARAYPGIRGLGVDRDVEVIAQACRRANTDQVRFEVGDAARVTGRYDAVINVAASHAHGGFPDALGAIRSLGAIVLYGEGFWQRPPSSEFLAGLGGATVDELAALEGLRSAICAAGFAIAHESLASEEDWAHYEETLASNAERDGSPDALAYARVIRDRRALPDGTDTLGFALFVLRV